MKNSYDVVLDGEDYTIGKVIEYFLLTKFYETKMMTFCGFKMMHPHDSYSIIRMAYKEPVEVSTIKGHLKECIEASNDTYQKLRKEFMKLVSR